MSAESIAAAALAGLHSMKPNAVVEALNKELAERREAARKEANGDSVGKPTDPTYVATCTTTFTANSTPTHVAASKHGPKKAAQKSQGGKKTKEEIKFPIEPRIIQIVKKPRTYMNHSYRDFSSVPPALDDEFPTEISKMTFPQKVHHILSQPEYSRFISWQPHGRAFRIIIPKMFETKVCSKYMGHTRYSSFLRQLSNHSFKHITQGKDRNCYYHEVCYNTCSIACRRAMVFLFLSNACFCAP